MDCKNELSKTKPCQIILLGKAGSGKGTFSVQLREKLDISLLCFGELLKENVRKKTKAGLILEKHIKDGTFSSDYLASDILISKFFTLKTPNRWIIEGFPRTLLQVQLFEEKVKDIATKMKVIYLDLSNEIATKRLLSRFMCPKCFSVYNTITKPSKIFGVCDFCKSPLYHREDDNEKIIKTRLQLFKEKSLPVIEYYKKLNKLFIIDANQSIEKIYSLILEILAN